VQAADAERTTQRGDLVSIFSGDVHVPANMRLIGNAVAIGGKVRIEGEVTGEVVVVLGELELAGHVEGQVAAVLSDQAVRGARIDGDYVSVLGTLAMRETTVGGQLVNVLSRLDQDRGSTSPIVNVGAWVPGIEALLLWVRLARLLVIFVTLVLIVALAPERVRVIGDEAPVRYVAAFFAGLLGCLALAVISVLLTLSIVGIPFLVLAWWALEWLGVAGVFFAVGRRLGRSLGREISVLGAVLGSFAIYALLVLAPTPLGLWGLPLSLLIGAAFFLAVQVPAIGLLILTRLGTARSVAPVGPAR
jgi:hypothetical protein